MNIDQSISERQEAYNMLAQRTFVPNGLPSEQLYNDDQIITYQNHPIVKNNNYIRSFYPSFVGKTWGTMKKMEHNRNNTDFFTSQDINPDLKRLYETLTKDGYIHFDEYKDYVNEWLKNKTDALRIPSIMNLPNSDDEIVYLPYDIVPTDVHSLEIYYHFDIGKDIEIPLSFAERTSLRALKICSTVTLPVMPHIEILIWNPIITDALSLQKYDFTGWTNLKILKLVDLNDNYNIRLPKSLVSLNIIQYHRSNKSKNIYEIFGNTAPIFQALQHVHLSDVSLSNLPTLYNCQYFFMKFCNNIQFVELPKCKSFYAHFCKKLVGFGPLTLMHNQSLECVHLFITDAQNQDSSQNQLFHLPKGAPSGYRHIKIYCKNNAALASLPKLFAPHAYISIIDFGSKLYIGDKQVRNNLIFYFDHEKAMSTKQCFPKKGETLKDMVDRIYEFNWPKFITKLQQQYRFKKYIKNMHNLLLNRVPVQDICIHEIAKMLGAVKTIGAHKKKVLIT